MGDRGPAQGNSRGFVVAAHWEGVWPHFLTGVGGVAAVESFFVISGFYMSLVLSRTYSGKVHAFWFNRVLRIMPQYWVVAFATLLARLVLGDYARTLGHLPTDARTLVATSNTFILGSDLVNFFHLSSGELTMGPSGPGQQRLNYFALLPQAWTLSLELVFYLAAPWLVRTRSRYLALFALASLGSKFVLGAVLLHLPDPWTYRFLLFEFGYFTLGVLIHRHLLPFAVELIATERNSATVWIAVTVFVSVFLPGYVDHAILAAGADSAYLGSGIKVACLSLMVPFAFAATSEARWDRRLGEYSYPIYLSHVLVLNAIDRFAGLGGSRTATLALGLAGIAAASHALTRMSAGIERLRTRIRAA